MTTVANERTHRRAHFTSTMRITILICCLLMVGCQSLGTHVMATRGFSDRGATTGIRVQRGRPNRLVDGLGTVVGIPTKLALWDRRADNHAVSPQTEAAVLEYMDRNGLDGGMVRINQYDPWGEWMRLTSNKRISPSWRYTAGSYNGLKYTLLPGRVFGGDWYNPFTDTTHVYSDIAPLVISRAAYAKDIRSQKYPGTYAVTQEVPFISMIHETRATREALAYSKQHGTMDEQAESLRILAPDYGSSWGGQLASFVPFGTPLGRLAGAAVGHATSRFQSGSNTDSEQMTQSSHCDVSDLDWNDVELRE